MIILDKELQAELDLERKMEDARDIEIEQSRYDYYDKEVN